ncbi:aegerolysin family protein [Fluviicola sp.]|uniref:aegerolysin family protein n=1 Tax=Fluviicola sp. TaxID=1917219 RepID=UPI0026169E0C|nr:aegerolysin family protein [Fluviicola sp.]
MANPQWVAITIYPSNFDVIIKELDLFTGKFFQDEAGKDHEISSSVIEGVKIPSGKSYTIYSSGKNELKDGTAGSFELYGENSERIGMYSWECLWRSLRNVSVWKSSVEEPLKRKYTTELSGGDMTSISLGMVSLQVTRIRH